jgi:hypothetical protein
LPCIFLGFCFIFSITHDTAISNIETDYFFLQVFFLKTVNKFISPFSMHYVIPLNASEYSAEPDLCSRVPVRISFKNMNEIHSVNEMSNIVILVMIIIILSLIILRSFCYESE